MDNEQRKYIKWKSWHGDIAFFIDSLPTSKIKDIIKIGESEDKSGSGCGGAVYWMDFDFDSNGKATPINDKGITFQPYIGTNRDDPASMNLYVLFTIDYDLKPNSRSDHGGALSYLIMQSTNGMWWLGLQHYSGGCVVDCPAGSSENELYVGVLDAILKWKLLRVRHLGEDIPSGLFIETYPIDNANAFIDKKEDIKIPLSVWIQ